MTTITHGGPAFPVPLHPGQSYPGHAPCDGMTLRDYFAAKAMQSLITAANGVAFGDNNAENNSAYAHVAYVLADAMIVARGET
jgi:hypothetical protein